MKSKFAIALIALSTSVFAQTAPPLDLTEKAEIREAFYSLGSIVAGTFNLYVSAKDFKTLSNKLAINAKIPKDVEVFDADKGILKHMWGGEIVLKPYTKNSENDAFYVEYQKVPLKPCIYMVDAALKHVSPNVQINKENISLETGTEAKLVSTCKASNTIRFYPPELTQRGLIEFQKPAM